jgi:hypothetical protein
MMDVKAGRKKSSCQEGHQTMSIFEERRQLLNTQTA